MIDFDIDSEYKACRWCWITVALIGLSSFCFAIWLCMDMQSMAPLVVWIVVAIAFLVLANDDEFDPWEDGYE